MIKCGLDYAILRCEEYAFELVLLIPPGLVPEGKCGWRKVVTASPNL